MSRKNIRIKGECMENEDKALLSCCQTTRHTENQTHTHTHAREDVL